MDHGIDKDEEVEFIIIKTNSNDSLRTTLSTDYSVRGSDRKYGICLKIPTLLRRPRWDKLKANSGDLPRADPGHRLLAVPAGLHLHADPLHHTGVPGKEVTVPQFLTSITQVRTENNEDELLFFRVAEGIFVGWFTLEYLVRYLVAPQKADISPLLRLLQRAIF